MKQLLTLALLSVVFSEAIIAEADVVVDEFENGVLDSLWSIDAVGGYAVVEENGCLHLELSEGTKPEYLVIRSTFVLSGDFDASIEFRDFSTGECAYNRQAALIIWSGEQVYGEVKIVDSSYRGGRVYAMYFPGFIRKVSKLMCDVSGGFKITRVGNDFHGYYQQRGSWVLLGSVTCPWPDLYVGFTISHDEPSFPWVSVDYDNFYVEADQIIAEPVSLSFLVLGGLAMVRRRWK